eukprot:350766-Chlamydomonas_euryale.AAC.2
MPHSQDAVVRHLKERRRAQAPSQTSGSHLLPRVPWTQPLLSRPPWASPQFSFLGSRAAELRPTQERQASYPPGRVLWKHPLGSSQPPRPPA